MRIVCSANSGEQSRIVAKLGNRGEGEGNSYECSERNLVPSISQSTSQNVGWDFSAKKHRRLSGQNVFLNIISSVLTAAKA